MKSSSPKLPLTQEERIRLRGANLKIKDIVRTTPEELADVLGSTLERAHLLCALTSFQIVPSIGLRAAQWMVDLGYASLDEVKAETGSDLLNRLEERYGCRLDPCVEDALRCIVYHANNPNTEKRWFDFTEERKTYRAQYGYPAGRPSLAWYDAGKGSSLRQWGR